MFFLCIASLVKDVPINYHGSLSSFEDDQQLHHYEMLQLKALHYSTPLYFQILILAYLNAFYAPDKWNY
jgi:hypothetical protein